MTRRAFNYNVAVSCLSDRCISIDFRKLAKVAAEAGFTEMNTKKTAREAFVSDIIDILNDFKLTRTEFKVLYPAICEISYRVENLCIIPSLVNVRSRCIVIGRLGYVYESSVDVRRKDWYDLVAYGERGKAKKIFTEYDADFGFDLYSRVKHWEHNSHG